MRWMPLTEVSVEEVGGSGEKKIQSTCRVRIGIRGWDALPTTHRP